MRILICLALCALCSCQKYREYECNKMLNKFNMHNRLLNANLTMLYIRTIEYRNTNDCGVYKAVMHKIHEIDSMYYVSYDYMESIKNSGGILKENKFDVYNSFDIIEKNREIFIELKHAMIKDKSCK